VQGIQRKRDALAALILALLIHYPSTYERYLAGVGPVESIVPSDVSGRVVKLYRVAREKLAEYL
jgi:hypothetical protein